MNIKVICVGKLKEGYLREIFREYQNKISSTGKNLKFSVIEVEDEKAPENIGITMGEQIKNREGQRIKRFIKETDHVITLEIKGKNISTEQLGNYLYTQYNNGRDIAFVIGGSLGISQEILNNSNYAVSFSKMTFPHQLARLILVEQLYKILCV